VEEEGWIGKMGRGVELEKGRRWRTVRVEGECWCRRERGGGNGWGELRGSKGEGCIEG